MLHIQQTTCLNYTCSYRPVVPSVEVCSAHITMECFFVGPVHQKHCTLYSAAPLYRVPQTRPLAKNTSESLPVCIRGPPHIQCSSLITNTSGLTQFVHCQRWSLYNITTLYFGECKYSCSYDQYE